MSSNEGVAFRPMPLERATSHEAKAPPVTVRDTGAPLCEMCGSPILSAHCKRICLTCGFMTGCSEGI